MKTQILYPNNSTIKRYHSNESILFVCNSTDGPFEVNLPDAYVVRDNGIFYFQKDNDGNTIYIVAQFGQSINGVERISLVWQYHSIMVVSDKSNYRVIAGIVPELPSTWMLGPYWRFRPIGYDLNLEKDVGLGSGNWQPYDELKMT